MVCLFEYNKNSLLLRHKQYNDNQVAYLSEYIRRYLINEN
jgi:hypothetical protein